MRNLRETEWKFLLKREKEEFHIIEAVNGKDAVGILASNHVDILLSDVKMPYMNGLDLAGHVKENYPDIEIVIFSGYNDFFLCPGGAEIRLWWIMS